MSVCWYSEYRMLLERKISILLTNEKKKDFWRHLTSQPASVEHFVQLNRLFFYKIKSSKKRYAQRFLAKVNELVKMPDWQTEFFVQPEYIIDPPPFHWKTFIKLIRYEFFLKFGWTKLVQFPLKIFIRWRLRRQAKSSWEK